MALIKNTKLKSDDSVNTIQYYHCAAQTLQRHLPCVKD